MVQAFKSFLETYSLLQPNDKVLLAVSGGIDSVVMTRLFADAGWPFSIAHVNFQLRGEESTLDETFVGDIARSHGCPLFIHRVDTAHYAHVNKLSIQMAAREIRYQWFETIRCAEGFDRVATAHHRDDQIETFFIHLLRGTGIAGLHGIPVKANAVIRPLLFASRREIESFALKNNLLFREDSSNAKTTYLRNQIRHQLIPVISSIQPRFAEAITTTIHHLQDSEALLAPVIESTRNRLFIQHANQWRVPLDELEKLHPLDAWLYALFSPHGFPEETLRDLANGLRGESGKQFLSPLFRIVKDRDNLILSANNNADLASVEETLSIHEDNRELQTPLPLSLHCSEYTSPLQISHDPLIATIDRDLVQFPLTLRKWKAGDIFFPFGMNQHKKLSDFLIDEKIALPDKESIWLLCAGKQVIWVIGHRIDNRFRITSKTREVLTITLHHHRLPNNHCLI